MERAGAGAGHHGAHGAGGSHGGGVQGSPSGHAHTLILLNQQEEQYVPPPPPPLKLPDTFWTTFYLDYMITIT